MGLSIGRGIPASTTDPGETKDGPMNRASHNYAYPAGIDDAPGMPARHVWLVPPLPGAGLEHHFVDLHRDVSASEVARAIGAGIRSIEHVKRFTLAGTGADQGKLASANTMVVAATLLGVGPGDLGTFVDAGAGAAGVVLVTRRACEAAPVRPGADDLDPLVARRAGRGVRGRRAVEAPPLFPASRRIDGGRRPARMRRRPNVGRRRRRFDARED